MRKSSSNSSRDTRPGPKNTFKKEGEGKSYNKSAKPFKKNYDGRSPSAGAAGEGGSSRSSKPYSGRLTESDKPKRSFDKPSFGKERSAGSRDTRKEFDKPRRSGEDSRPFSDRPKRSFDKPSFRKDDRSEDTDRKPRREFDKPGRPGNDRKPFSDQPKRTFDKPSFRKEDSNEDSDRKPRREFDKPGRSGSDRKPFSDRPKRTFDKPSFRKDDRKDDRSEDTDRKPRREFDKSGAGNDGKPFNDRPKRSFDKPLFDKKDSKDRTDNRPGKDFDKPKSFKDTRPFRDRPKPAPGKRSFDNKENKKGEAEGANTFSDVVKNAFNQPKATEKDKENHPGKRQQFEDQVYGELEDDVAEERPKRPFEKKPIPGKKKHVHDHSEGRKKKYKDDEDEDDDDKEINQTNGPRLEMPLNKFIAHSGECSRRDAAELVKQGKVKVNGELVLDPGYRVKHDDKVTMSGKKLTPQKGMVYILLNKPKGFITTNDDPQGRKTVMELVASSGAERLFPVGRLDRDTSGLLLITNDGDLTQKLSHPAYNIKKVYQVTLDKLLTKAHFEQIVEGVELEDGKAVVDSLAYLEKKNELGLEIHSGRNRIVRRIFESLGYVVEKLDRVMYAGLTKKNLPRSKWRYLDEREVVLLKHFKS